MHIVTSHEQNSCSAADSPLIHFRIARYVSITVARGDGGGGDGCGGAGDGAGARLLGLHRMTAYSRGQHPNSLARRGSFGLRTPAQTAQKVHHCTSVMPYPSVPRHACDLLARA